MVEVRITSGTFGLHYKNRVRPIHRGESCLVDEAIADRLVAIGVAVIVEPVAQPVDATKCADTVNIPDEKENAENGRNYDEMSFAELKALAINMGISTNGIRSKAKMISAITGE